MWFLNIIVNLQRNKRFFYKYIYMYLCIYIKENIIIGEQKTKYWPTSRKRVFAGLQYCSETHITFSVNMFRKIEFYTPNII